MLKEKFVEHFLHPAFNSSLNKTEASETLVKLLEDFGKLCTPQETNIFGNLLLKNVNYISTNKTVEHISPNHNSEMKRYTSEVGNSALKLYLF